MKPAVLLVTCEHASNHIPEKYLSFFGEAREDLDSHRGWDPGALELAIYLSKALNAVLFTYDHSRLLIEVNRSVGHPQLFSEYSLALGEEARQDLVDKFYYPYRIRVENCIRQLVAEGSQVLHLSVHSFTPVYQNVVREVEIGLLFDPERRSERLFCNDWQANLLDMECPWVVRYNEPYLGKDDGFTTFLRGLFSQDEYMGIELEVNQKLIPHMLELSKLIRDSLMAAVR